MIIKVLEIPVNSEKYPSFQLFIILLIIIRKEGYPVNIPEGYVRVNMDVLWHEYIKFMRGKRDNPFHYCGCITSTGIHYPIHDR
jgi:hypothetical protein